jgi:dGTPase
MNIEAWNERQSGWRKQTDDTRSEFEIDYSRVIHSASFRRLQGKTQVFNLGDSDFYRTRLTHSMEVAQIGVSLLKQLKKKDDEAWRDSLPPSELIFTLGVSHDLGHPPFGHGGEVALNYCMRDVGGFEGNGQSLRIASRLEKFSKAHGFDFTRRSLLGILKYPTPHGAAFNKEFTPKLAPSVGNGVYFSGKTCKPPKCFFDTELDVVDFILDPLPVAERALFQTAIPENFEHEKHKKPVHKSLDCSIMDLADDISYGVHDLEDAIAMGLVSRSDVRRHLGSNTAAVFLENLSSRYATEFPSAKEEKELFDILMDKLFNDSDTRKRMIGRMVHFFVSSVIMAEEEGFIEPLLRFRANLPEAHRNFLDALKKIVEEEVVFSPHVQHLEFKGQQMVVSVFTAIANSPERFLPSEEKRLFKDGYDLRVICDYIAGMTDSYLLRLYERLFSPRMGSLFDRL